MNSEIPKAERKIIEELESEGIFTNLHYRIKNGHIVGLSITEKGLTGLPNNLGNLSNLVSLNLAENNLKRLPESIGNLVNLEYLSLAKNKIKNLPESIGWKSH